jgi:hypothetical protein
MDTFKNAGKQLTKERFTVDTTKKEGKGKTKNWTGEGLLSF